MRLSSPLYHPSDLKLFRKLFTEIFHRGRVDPIQRLVEVGGIARSAFVNLGTRLRIMKSAHQNRVHEHSIEVTSTCKAHLPLQGTIVAAIEFRLNSNVHVQS